MIGILAKTGTRLTAFERGDQSPANTSSGRIERYIGIGFARLETGNAHTERPIDLQPHLDASRDKSCGCATGSM